MDFDKVVEFLSNKRNKAIVVLGLYLIFFIFMATFFRTYKTDLNNDVKDTKKDAITDFCSLANYEYTYLYKEGEIEKELSGKVFRTDNYFEYYLSNYYIRDGIIYQYIDNNYEESSFDLNIYTISQICDMYNNSNLVSKSENYETNEYISKYSVKQDELEENIYLSLIEKNAEINKILIEKGNVYVSIEYKNKGKVKNFTSLFDKNIINEEEKEVEF